MNGPDPANTVTKTLKRRCRSYLGHTEEEIAEIVFAAEGTSVETYEPLSAEEIGDLVAVLREVAEKAGVTL